MNEFIEVEIVEDVTDLNNEANALIEVGIFHGGVLLGMQELSKIVVILVHIVRERVFEKNITVFIIDREENFS